MTDTTTPSLVLTGLGVKVIVLDAQQQRRTARDVRGPWVRPRTPSKKSGRTGSRKRWKRLNAPHYLWFYREPEDMLRYPDPWSGAPTIIATPRQAEALRRATTEQPQ